MAGEEIEWLSQTECAARLARAGDMVSQQKISRYLARYPEIPRQDFGPRQPMLVDFAALKRHRSENIRVQERREDEEGDDPPPAIAETHAAAADAPPPSAETRAAAANTGANADLRHRERLAAAEKAEFELAKARGELIPRAIVVKAIRAAGVAMHQAAKQSRLDRAEELERAKDNRERAQILETQDAALFTEFARRALALGGDEEPDDVIDDEEIAAGVAGEAENSGHQAK